jgi:hypothetical protein
VLDILLVPEAQFAGDDVWLKEAGSGAFELLAVDNILCARCDGSKIFRVAGFLCALPDGSCADLPLVFDFA